MKMHFEWAWMNHEDPEEHLKDHETLVLVQVTIKWRTKWHKYKHQKTNEPQNIKSQGSKMKKNATSNVNFLIMEPTFYVWWTINEEELQTILSLIKIIKHHHLFYSLGTEEFVG